MEGACQGIWQTWPKHRRGGVLSVRSSRGTRVVWFAGALRRGAPTCSWAWKAVVGFGGVPGMSVGPFHGI